MSHTYMTLYSCSHHQQDLDGNCRVEGVRTVLLSNLPHSGHAPQPINTGHTHTLPTGDVVMGGAKAGELAGLVLEGCVVRYFEHRHLRYLYRPSVDKFVLLRGLDAGHTPSDLHQMKSGLLIGGHAMR